MKWNWHCHERNLFESLLVSNLFLSFAGTNMKNKHNNIDIQYRGPYIGTELLISHLYSCVPRATALPAGLTGCHWGNGVSLRFNDL